MLRSPVLLRALPTLPIGCVALRAAPLVPALGLRGLWWVCSGVGWGGVALMLPRVPSPGVSPWGGQCLHSPSGCNSVVRAVHFYPLRTNGPVPKPGTPAVPHTGVAYSSGRWGVLAGQAHTLPAPMDSVPYSQPLAGHEPQYVPWGVLLVRPIADSPGPVPPRAADQRSRAYPTLLRVLRWGRYSHREGPQTPEAGLLACVACGLLASPLPSRCVGLGGGSFATSGWGAVVVPGGAGLAPVVFVALPRLSWLPVVVAGLSPLLAEGPGWDSLPLLAGVRWWCWEGGGVVLRHSLLRSAGLCGAARWGFSRHS